MEILFDQMSPRGFAIIQTCRPDGRVRTEKELAHGRASLNTGLSAAQTPPLIWKLCQASSRPPLHVRGPPSPAVGNYKYLDQPAVLS